MTKIKFQVAFIVSLIILISVALSVYLTFKNFQKDAIWVAHSEHVKAEIENLSNLPKDISHEMQKAILIGDTLDLKLIHRIEIEIPAIYKVLDSLILDNQEQSKNLDQLMGLITDYTKNGKLFLQLNDHTNLRRDSLRNMIKNQEDLVDSIDMKARYMKAVENKILKERVAERQESQIWTPLTLFSLTVIALSIIIFLFINIMALSKKSEEAARRLEGKVFELNKEIDHRIYLEELIKSVLNSSTNGIMALESVRDHGKIADFRFTTVNEKAIEIVHLPKAETSNLTLLSLPLENKKRKMFDTYVDIVETGANYHAVKNYELGGKSYWFDVSGVKNRDGIVVTFADITIQKEHERELLLKQKELEDTNYELEQFAYIASHDLQEPLRKIRTFGDRLVSISNGVNNDKFKDYIFRMQNAAERMQKLIDDLLKFSRISRAEFSSTAVNLNEVLKEAKENLEVDIEIKKAKIKNDSLPVVEGDKGQLIQLFQNILSNSLKYSKVGIDPEVIISADTVPKSSGSEDWKISFKDNGIGFDPSFKEKIFVIFQRLHGRTEYEGTGIGLAICEKIVSNMGGKIEADSKLGEGATFTIYLPKS